MTEVVRKSRPLAANQPWWRNESSGRCLAAHGEQQSGHDHGHAGTGAVG